MLKKLGVLLGFFCFIFLDQSVFAQTGNLFNVNASGTAGSIQIRLCLNGRGPSSCENYTVDGQTLTILTTIPNRVYPQVGIKIFTPGYAASGCTNYSNGYCIFSANNSSAATITLSSTSNVVSLSNISPTSGATSGGTGFILTGSNLTGTTSITFDGTPATSVNVTNATTVTGVTPSHAAGAVDVTISTPNGSATLTNGYTYATTAVGQSAYGGTVACLNGGSNDLIAATTDNSTNIGWGGSGTTTGATSNTDGTTNTATITSILGSNGGTPYAAKVCSDYEVDSQGNTPCQPGNTCYNDWFLPAINQLQCLYTNRIAIGGFDNADGYWSSTEATANTANIWDFLNTIAVPISKTINIDVNVRCARIFTP